jgi:hypothetical protein
VFIVLVILLAVIVIAASAGIYLLLRYGEPSAADRVLRRKYSIRRHGVRTHPLPIGLPTSFSEKIGSVFKGRRAGGGWVPARDEEDEWDTTDEPLRERGQHHLNEPYDPQQQHDSFPRVGSAPASSRATLTEASDIVQLSRAASHVDTDDKSSSEGFGRDASSIVHVHTPPAPKTEPEEGWFSAAYSTGPSATGTGSRDPNSVGYFAPQPRRADFVQQDIPLFAGNTPFRQDV